MNNEEAVEIGITLTYNLDDVDGYRFTINVDPETSDGAITDAVSALTCYRDKLVAAYRLRQDQSAVETELDDMRGKAA